MITIYFVSLALVWWIAIEEWTESACSSTTGMLLTCVVGAVPALNTIAAAYAVGKLSLECGSMASHRRMLDAQEHLEEAAS